MGTSTRSATSPMIIAMPTSFTRSSRAATTVRVPSCSAPTSRSLNGPRSSPTRPARSPLSIASFTAPRSSTSPATAIASKRPKNAPPPSPRPAPRASVPASPRPAPKSAGDSQFWAPKLRGFSQPPTPCALMPVIGVSSSPIAPSGLGPWTGACSRGRLQILVAGKVPDGERWGASDTGASVKK